MSGFQIRSATMADLPDITTIYAHHVLHGTASFELVPPDTEEMARRFAKMEEQGWPWLVIVSDQNRVEGYAYASQFRERPAYRLTVENSVYVRDGMAGHGLGRTLLTSLIEATAAAGGEQMLAVIGDSDNRASIRLHEACGFDHVGVFRNVGHKFGRVLDIVLMQRTLVGPSAVKEVHD